MAGVIKYVGGTPGINSERVISAKDFAAAGAKGQKAVRWNAKNGYTVSQDDLTPEALELLRGDDGLVFVDEDAKGKAANPDYVGPQVVGYPGGRAPDTLVGSVGTTGGTPNTPGGSTTA